MTRDNIEAIAAANGYSVEEYDVSERYFGNMLIVVSKGDLLYRFVRDRGFVTCQIKCGHEPVAWSEYEFGLRGVSVDRSDICAVVGCVLRGR